MGPGARDGKIFRSSCLCSKIFFFALILGGRLKAKIKVIYCKIIYEDSDKGGKKIGKNFMTCLDLDF